MMIAGSNGKEKTLYSYSPLAVPVLKFPDLNSTMFSIKRKIIS